MRVSVVIPTLNRAAFLPRAIESVRAQPEVDVELLVVDQNSTDGTTELLDGLGVNWITEPERGAGWARQAGLRHTRQDYVLFLDSDDWLTNRALVHLGEILQGAPDATLAYGSHQRVDCTGQSPRIIDSAVFAAPMVSFSLTRRDRFDSKKAFEGDNHSWSRWVMESRARGNRFVQSGELVGYRGLHSGNVSLEPGSFQELIQIARQLRDRTS